MNCESTAQSEINHIGVKFDLLILFYSSRFADEIIS